MRERDRWGSEWVSEREREKDEESMRMGRKGKVPEKQMFQNCMTTMNVNIPWLEDLRS